MKARLYLDEDALDQDLARALRSNGIDVLTAFEAGMVKRPDEDQLRYATEQGRVLYTYNQDDYALISAELLSQGGSHAGILLGVQRRYSVGEQMRRMRNLIDSLSAEEMVNRVEYISAWKNPTSPNA